MLSEGPKRRVLFALETSWDRKQLAACTQDWAARAEPFFPEPNDVDCPPDFDLFDWAERAGEGAFGTVDGVLSSSDYPGTIAAALLADRLGLPGAAPRAVLRASHKYVSRLAQREAAPVATPRFALLAPGGAGELPFPFPAFVKPVKGSFSQLARRVSSAAELADYLAQPALREHTEDYLAIFNAAIARAADFAEDGRFAIAEELIRGQLVTVEGLTARGAPALLGVSDSIVDPRSGSFVRFDYPSALPEEVQARMGEVAERVVRRLGLDDTLWNVEMMWDAARDRIAIVEVNPRLCGQFGDLYQRVDGRSGFTHALDVALGEKPALQRRGGASALASSVPLRVFASARVVRAPSATEVAEVEQRFGALIWLECATGDALTVGSHVEDGASQRYAVINLGADAPRERDEKLAAIVRALGIELAPG